jgi:hypothetical protein
MPTMEPEFAYARSADGAYIGYLVLAMGLSTSQFSRSGRATST